MGFYPLADRMMDEATLVGSGRACRESLRPHAFNLLAEFIHQVNPKSESGSESESEPEP